MIAREIISDIVPALKTSDTGLKALSWMEIFRVSHLPIVNNKEFLGLISDTDIYDLNMADEPIGNHNLSLFSPYVTADQHIYEVIEVVSRLNLTLIPVLENKNFLGLITLTDLIHSFAGLLSVNNPGAIVILELHHNDYSLSEISRIIESNDSRILSVYTRSPEESMKMEVIIKVNTNDISSIVKTFERFNYNIKASYMDNEVLDSLYDKRFESFMRYLNT